ncbi:MAG: CBS domain-containing protein [Planctomycetaceae bacterium]|nr:CBS domain-containing protein [Planctomycetaceae bacterium]
MQTSLCDVISWTTLTVRPEMTVAEAMTLMADREVDHLFIVDSDDRFVGIVTDHSLLKAELNGQAAESTVAAWMHRHPETLTTTHTVADAAKLCRDASLSRIPVLRDGRLLGVVHRRSLLQWMVRSRLDQGGTAIAPPHHTSRELSPA